MFIELTKVDYLGKDEMVTINVERIEQFQQYNIKSSWITINNTSFEVKESYKDIKKQIIELNYKYK